MSGVKIKANFPNFIFPSIKKEGAKIPFDTHSDAPDSEDRWDWVERRCPKKLVQELNDFIDDFLRLRGYNPDD